MDVDPFLSRLPAVVLLMVLSAILRQMTNLQPLFQLAQPNVVLVSRMAPPHEGQFPRLSLEVRELVPLETSQASSHF